MAPLLLIEWQFTDNLLQLQEKILPMELLEQSKFYFNLSSMMELPTEDTELTSSNQNSKFLDQRHPVMFLTQPKQSLTTLEA
jgi:hypothetical protein